MSETLIGKLVHWEFKGQWFTARIVEDGLNGTGTRWIGEVVDPGNYIGLSEFTPGKALTVGERVPNLLEALLRVVPEAAP